MKKVLMASLVILGLTCGLGLRIANAQEDEGKFSFGKVVTVAEDQVAIQEYDFTQDADITTTYYVTPDTELANIDTFADLQADDDIVIDFVEKDGKKMITTLVKEEQEAETEMPADESLAEDAPAEMVPDLPAEDQPASDMEELPMLSPDEDAPAMAPAGQN